MKFLKRPKLQRHKWRHRQSLVFLFVLVNLLWWSSISLTFLPYSRPDSCSGCNPHHLRLTLNSPQICSGLPAPILLVLVHSRPESRNKRDAIRRTWASSANGRGDGVVGWSGDVTGKRKRRLVVVFIFGKREDEEIQNNLRRESEEFHDIVQDSFIDSYGNITLKALAGLAWATRFCADARFVAKVDDDVFFNVVNVVDFLEKFEGETLVGGSCSWGAPKRLPWTKWYVSPFSYPHLLYPTYCHGFALLYSAPAAAAIYAASRHVPFFPFDDVYLTGLVANRRLSLPVTHLPGFLFSGADEEDDCFRRREVMAAHGSGGEKLVEEWERAGEAVCRCERGRKKRGRKRGSRSVKERIISEKKKDEGIVPSKNVFT